MFLYLFWCWESNDIYDSALNYFHFLSTFHSFVEMFIVWCETNLLKNIGGRSEKMFGHTISWRDLRVKHNTKSQNSRKRDNIIYLWFWWPNKANYVKWSIPVNCFEMRCDWIRMGLVRMARNQFWIGERQRARAKEARVWKNSSKNCIIENRIRTKSWATNCNSSNKNIYSKETKTLSPIFFCICIWHTNWI